MTARHGIAFVVVGLVLVTGCSAVSLGGTESTPTLTPVPLTATETATPTPTPTPTADPPPGVSMDGDVSVEALVEAHESSLADRSYRWAFVHEVSDARAETFERDVTRRAAVDPEAFLVEQESRGARGNHSLYVTDGIGYYRTSAGGAPTFDEIPAPRSHDDYAFADSVLRRYLEDVRFDVTLVERDGETYYRLFSAEDRVPESVEDETATVTNYTATAYVTNDGFVRTLVVEYDRVRKTDIQHVSVRFDYEDVGATTVTRPDWLPDPTPISEDANATDANATDANATDANATDANATDANATDANATVTTDTPAPRVETVADDRTDGTGTPRPNGTVPPDTAPTPDIATSTPNPAPTSATEAPT